MKTATARMPWGNRRLTGGIVGLSFASCLLLGFPPLAGAQGQAPAPDSAKTQASAPPPNQADTKSDMRTPLDTVAKPGTDGTSVTPAKPEAAPAPEIMKPEEIAKIADPVLRAKAQLAADTARLYQLANELKAEMDKSTKDTLSLGVMRKADEIERLAKKVREEMQTSIGN
jgi:hypothetical protein